MFFGVAEPLSHYLNPPPGGAAGQSSAALQVAMATTLFHWTLHPWAIYAVVGLAIAYGTYRRGRCQLISVAFRPLIGEHANGPLGRVIDMMAIFATLFGSALPWAWAPCRSPAPGAQRLDRATGKMLYISIITVLTVAFVISAYPGSRRASSGCPTPTWCWRWPWPCSSSSSVRPC